MNDWCHSTYMSRINETANVYEFRSKRNVIKRDDVVQIFYWRNRTLLNQEVEEEEKLNYVIVLAVNIQIGKQILNKNNSWDSKHSIVISACNLFNEFSCI